MARFSRLRRSARLLLVATGFCGLSASTAVAEGWKCGFVAPSPSLQKAKDSAFWGLLEARRSGFQTMVQEGTTQEFGSRPLMVNGKTLAQVIVKQGANEDKTALHQLLSGTRHPAARFACAAMTQGCSDSANEADLETISLKFLAMEQIETAAVAHCREFALNAELCGSILMTAKGGTLSPDSTTVTEGTSVQLPTFAFTTVTYDCPPEAFSVWSASAAGMEAARQLLRTASPTPLVQHQVGADGLERIGIDFEITPRIIITEDEEDRLLGVATDETPAAPRTMAAMLLANATDNSYRARSTSGKLIEVSAFGAFASSYQALLDMPFSMDKLVTLSIEVSPLHECIVTHEQPVLRMSAITQERMFRHFAKPADRETAASQDPGAPGFIAPPDYMGAKIGPDYQFPEITSWKQLRASRGDAPAVNPEPDTGIEPQGDDFVQQLPSRDELPLENPPALAAVGGPVSPTMSPLEYAQTQLTDDERENLPLGTELLLSEHNALTGRESSFDLLDDPIITITRRIRAGHQDDHVLQTAHGEPIIATVPPTLRALGEPISVTPCESETCKGIVIQFAQTAKSDAVAEIAAFDGPAQIQLQDGPGKLAHGFAWPAQPAAPEESLDELAQRLEREFLRKAVSGQIQIPDDCPGASVAAPSGGRLSFNMPSPGLCSDAGICGNIVLDPECLPKVTPPGLCAERGTPGFAIAVPGCEAKFPSPCSCAQSKTCTCVGCPKACGGDCCCAKNDRPLPIPAVTLNPYYPGPGADTVLPRDFEFYAGMRGGSCSSSTCGSVCSGPECGTAAPACCDSPACTCSSACAAAQATPLPPQAHLPFGPAAMYPTRVPQLAAVAAPQPRAPAYVPCAPPLIAPQMAMVPQPQRHEWLAPVAASCVAPCTAPAVAAARPAVSPEMLEFHREVSRTLDQLAERCEAQGLFEKADELRDLAQEYRMGARVLHQHLNAMSFPMGPMPAVNPVAWYPTAPMMPAPMMPYPMPAPAMYVPEPTPTFGTMPSPVAPAAQPQPLPIARPLVLPRY